ncbi:Ribonucleotide reductase inhibitor [Macrophomina phaseolina MS6]|uniref:Ribonucleotide reductase inhibitor n=1 Tax=Macrophomina phaseolina (strain MS6) TaxID=1126212 RepID=K2RH77_MACPH|nr:Ribonucleotide reductase inhibitor [Macrophomina phaseolina MS6]
MSASAHRNKRPFQPSITSYFARVDRSDLDDDGAATSLPPSAADAPHQGLAAVPAAVQASLLNVGMRVRKSVPEGYKTHKTLNPLSATTTTAYYKPQTTTTPFAAARPAELLPFCGLQKTGGYTVQGPTPAPYAYDAGAAAIPVDAHGIAFAAENFGLSSQESNASTISTDSLPAAANAHKRRFEEEEDDGGMARAGRPLFPALNTSLAVPAASTDEEQISPRTTVYPVSHTAMPDLDAPMRPVVRPKSRMRNGVTVTVTDRRLAVNGEGFDFGEADFLKPQEDDGEVEMGGV